MSELEFEISDTERDLQKTVNEGFLLHGTTHKYEQYKDRVFIPKNHIIFANRSPIIALYHALFDDKTSKIQTKYYNGQIFSSVIVYCHEAFRKEGKIYVFKEDGFIKEQVTIKSKYGMCKKTLYKKDPKKPLLEIASIINVSEKDFKSPVYYKKNGKYSIIKDKTF